jgi:histidyl-tRNA synthetase
VIPLYQAPRGTQDILPEEQLYWRFIEQKATNIAQLYGYERIDTPVFEDAGLFVRTVGEGTDIVEKEMYSFTDRGGGQVTLRPEGTAPVCRAYLEHGMHNMVQPVKLFYVTPIFRYEKPQAGRFRQHHQFGCEAIGEADPSLDAEVIAMAWQFFSSLGLNDLTMQVNSIGCRQCRPVYLKALGYFYASHPQHICPECTLRLKRNPLRLLDCKKPQCQQVAASAPKSVDYLCSDCEEHLNRLKDYLGILGLPFNLNHCLVRGLDYYTRTVFEIQPHLEGSQSTICGGGRYDNLIEELGGQPTPAIGFASGIERIILNLMQEHAEIPAIPKPKVFFASTGHETQNEVVKQAALHRKSGIAVFQTLGAKSLKAQLRQANAFGVTFTVIFGEEELKSGMAILRNMTTAQQELVAINDLASLLKKEAISVFSEYLYSQPTYSRLANP